MVSCKLFYSKAHTKKCLYAFFCNACPADVLAAAYCCLSYFPTTREYARLAMQELQPPELQPLALEVKSALATLKYLPIPQPLLPQVGEACGKSLTGSQCML
jgi:hypothetical protein